MITWTSRTERHLDRTLKGMKSPNNNMPITNNYNSTYRYLRLMKTSRRTSKCRDQERLSSILKFCEVEANTYPTHDRPSPHRSGQTGFCSTHTVNSDVYQPILVSGLFRPVSFRLHPGIRGRFGFDAWALCGPPQRWLQFHCRVGIPQAARLKISDLNSTFIISLAWKINNFFYLSTLSINSYDELNPRRRPRSVVLSGITVPSSATTSNNNFTL